ncbi:HAMP domain-containing histidine kinase [Bacillus sp. FJAT-50079]|nr:HAMP domain-containing histidine kinase [Bacillus sp. FJAT-50079]
MGLLICAIGLIPIVLALTMHNFYKESKLSVGLVIYMLLITLWQFDVGILYFEGLLKEEIILILFKLFRMGPTFSIPVVFYVAYSIIKLQPTMLKGNKWLSKILMILFNNITLYVLIIWSAIVYIINWTPLGIKAIHLTKTYSSLDYFFPEYGSLTWIYIIHVGSFILFQSLVFIISKTIMNVNIRYFLRNFSIYSILLFVSGFLNFSSETGGISSSIGVVTFSTLIVREFIKLNENIKLDYYQLMERQRKLDYLGNLSGSLIHEVKNTNQIISGFSKLLTKSETLSDKDKSLLDMVNRSSIHLEDLVNNYVKYMNSSKVTLKIEDLESVIQESIDFTQEMLRKNNVEITFVNNFKSLKAYVNKTNLEQAFINLINNSIEAIPNNKENKNITIKTEVNEGTILIHFIDTGKGIPQENWDSVFDPFMSFKEKGMGLGLPFVKKIFIEHLGNISIVESSSEGTHFQIEIPQNGILDSSQTELLGNVK